YDERRRRIERAATEWLARHRQGSDPTPEPTPPSPVPEPGPTAPLPPEDPTGRVTVTTDPAGRTSPAPGNDRLPVSPAAAEVVVRTGPDGEPNIASDLDKIQSALREHGTVQLTWEQRSSAS